MNTIEWLSNRNEYYTFQGETLVYESSNLGGRTIEQIQAYKR